MTTITEDAIEFRCTHCWQTNFVPVNYASSNVPCGNCNVEVLVPEATPERLRTPEQVEAVLASVNDDVPEVSPYASEAELMRLVRSDTNLPLEQRYFGGHPNASLLLRLAANFLDGLFVVATVIVGILMIQAGISAGLLTEMREDSVDWGALAVLYFPVLVGSVVQWNLVATRGQSIGKFLCCIRIVTMEGRLPGFVQGVVLRSWVCMLLAMIPLFSLIDILWIFGSANRCLHDHVAGTRVVPSS